MDIRTTLLEKHSRDQMLRIVAYVGDDQERFDELLGYMLNDEYRVVQRSAWAVLHAVKAHPHFIEGHLEKLIENLNKPKLPDAVKRNTMRLLQDVELPEELMGIMAEIAFRILDDPKEPIAARVFSMTVLYNICKKEPELGNELRMVIEDHLPHGSAGFKSRGKKTLKDLGKLKI